MGTTIRMVQGDRYPVLTNTLKDSNSVQSDPRDPDTWPIIDLSVNVDSVRIDYYTRGFQLLDVTIDFASNKIDVVGHGLSNDDRVRFSSSGTFPTGLDEITLFYVVNKNEDDFQVSLTEGGAAVSISDAGVGQLNVIMQFDTQAGTLIGGGTGGQFSWTHPTLVWENPGDYELEYVVIRTTPAGKETVIDRDHLELRRR